MNIPHQSNHFIAECRFPFFLHHQLKQSADISETVKNTSLTDVSSSTARVETFAINYKLLTDRPA